MNTEVFRFTAIRPAQQTDAGNGNEQTLILFKEDTPFLTRLQSARQASLEAMRASVTQFVQSANYIQSPAGLQAVWAQWNNYLLLNAGVKNILDLNGAVENIFGKNTSAVIADNTFKEARSKLADSILASLIQEQGNVQVQNFQVRYLKIMGLVEKLANTTQEDLDVSSALSVSLILPKQIFPLPAAKTSLDEQVKKQEQEKNTAKLQAEEQRKKLLQEIETTKTAFSEVQKAMESEKIELNASPDPKKRLTIRGFYLETAAVAKLSDQTKNTLKKFTPDAQNIDASLLLPKMENHLSELNGKLSESVGYSSMVYKLGDVFLAESPVNLDIYPSRIEKPGPCTITPGVTTVPDNQDFVPVGYGRARVLGIMDLLLVEQKLSHYEKGEIAHVENVLMGEKRERVHKQINTRDETLVTESESTDEKEQDLSTTERYELQVQTQQVLQDTTTYDAGVTANAYGVGYNVTAHGNIAGNLSSTESTSSSSNFARDITKRAVNKITNRTLERRTLRTIEKVIERNLHSFDNVSGTEHIVGVYRWLDKLYDAQVVRYGKRLLLEFMVPEPSAFYRYAVQMQPLETAVIIKPDDPGYCINGTLFRPLQAKDIDRGNYLLWANKYNASNLTPPPPTYRVVGDAFASEDSSKLQNKVGDNMFYWLAEKASITIPEGYYPEKAKVNFDTVLIDSVGVGPAGSNLMTVQIEDTQISSNSSGNTLYLSQFSTDSLPISITAYNIVTYGLTITVFCKLSDAKFEEWQLKTYTAIMQAYNDSKSKYEAQLAGDRINRGLGLVTGKNPQLNREIEKTELKKGCLTLLTGQRFELFNSMMQNVTYVNGKFGYPEIVSFDDAEAEGTYIEFFEQAMEWNNILYVFYPYFWAEKSQWVQLSQINDSDTLFSKFLQAGSARVQVPVRPGFEFALQTYLQTGKLWQAEGSFVDVNNDGIPDDLQLSILTELKEGDLKPDGESNGEPVGDKWQVRIPTSLVIIDKDPTIIQ